jgi:uncharacterized OsmC-like protein
MARFRAILTNQPGVNEVSLQVNQQLHSLAIPPKVEGAGSSISGGELLLLALATCYGNDIYREAARRGIPVERVEVDVECDFEREGGPASNVSYTARVQADASHDEILDLMQHTDRVAEIHNTLRSATPVTLKSFEVIPRG